MATVKHHVHNILDKLGTPRRTQAMRRVRDAPWLVNHPSTLADRKGVYTLRIGSTPLARDGDPIGPDAFLLSATHPSFPLKKRVVAAPGYRGVPVIGAWTWLPAYEMGIAAEQNVSEAYRPLYILRR